jgi:hypothetical protein
MPVLLLLGTMVEVYPTARPVHAGISDTTVVVVLAEPAVNSINEGLGKSKARVQASFGTFPVEKPKATPHGLAFRKTPGYPPKRPAIVTDASWDTIPPAPNPIPWSEIRTIEARHSSELAGGILGGLVGLGLYSGFLYYAVESGADGPGAMASAAIPVALGFGIGYLLGGMGERWEPVYTASGAPRAP